jgi:hypothetical protein
MSSVTHSPPSTPIRRPSGESADNTPIKKRRVEGSFSNTATPSSTPVSSPVKQDKPCGVCKICISKAKKGPNWNLSEEIVKHNTAMYRIKCDSTILERCITRKEYKLYIILKWFEIIEPVVLLESPEMRSEATSLLNKGKAILELFGTERESQRGVVNAMKKEADRLRAMDYDDLSSFEKDSLNAADTYIRNTTANFQSSDNLIDRYMAVTSFTSRILSGFVTDHSNF